MNTVTAVEVNQGVSQKTGKPYSKYNVTLDDGRVASGFTYAKVGDQVVVQQQGAFLNFTPAGAVTSGRSGAAPVVHTPSDGTDRSSRIERQHSQEMALRFFALDPEGNIPDTKKLRGMIDWFQRDVGHVPGPPKPKVEDEPEPQEPIVNDILRAQGGGEDGEPF
jgi:hypothetical protein